MTKLDAVFDLLKQVDFSSDTLRQGVIALGVTVGVGAGLWLTKRMLVRRAEARTKTHPSRWLDTVGDLLRCTKGWFLLILSLYGGSLPLALPDKAARIADSVAAISLLVQAALWGEVLVRSLLLHRATQRAQTDAAGATILTALGFLIRLAIWTTVTLLALANAGINVTAMVAGLGIGGIAIALAAQNILVDLFASASIVLDRPFVLGDFIIVDQDMGTVERIGVKTTRIRSLSGEQIIFANNDLLKSRIHNFKRMADRRAVFSIGVTYQTSADKLAAIPAMLREAVQAQSATRFDRAHFKQYGDAALVFEVVYYVLSPDYNLYMDIQQAINLAVFRRFAQEQIEFASPPCTVCLKK